jgi:hypothetical protein
MKVFLLEQVPQDLGQTYRTATFCIVPLQLLTAQVGYKSTQALNKKINKLLAKNFLRIFSPKICMVLELRKSLS